MVIDIIIVLLVTLGMFFSIKNIVKNRKNGGCAGCSCSECNKNCDSNLKLIH